MFPSINPHNLAETILRAAGMVFWIKSHARRIGASEFEAALPGLGIDDCELLLEMCFPEKMCYIVIGAQIDYAFALYGICVLYRLIPNDEKRGFFIEKIT